MEPLSPLNFDDSPVKIPIGPKPALSVDSNKFKKIKALNEFLLEKVTTWHKLQIEIDLLIEAETLNNKNLKKDKRNLKYMSVKRLLKKEDFDTVFKMFQDHKENQK